MRHWKRRLPTTPNKKTHLPLLQRRELLDGRLHRACLCSLSLSAARAAIPRDSLHLQISNWAHLGGVLRAQALCAGESAVRADAVASPPCCYSFFGVCAATKKISNKV